MHNAKTKKTSRPKSDAIQAILAAAGVEYTHENSEVVGSSKVEAHLSRRAEEMGNEVGIGEERLFADSQPRGEYTNTKPRFTPFTSWDASHIAH